MGLARISWMETLFQDVRYGLRVLRKSPGFTITAVLTLALGIGANTSIFSLVNGILLQPLAYPQPDRLLRIANGYFPQGCLVALRDQAKVMDIGTYAEGKDFNMTGWGEPVRLTGTLVSAELLSILGTPPVLGRVFQPTEDRAGNDQSVILSHALWQQKFGGDPQIIGKSIVLEGVGRQIIGVMPASFRFPSARTELWVPLHIDARSVSTYWAGDFMPAIARLHTGASLAQADVESRLLQSRLPALFPWKMPSSWNDNVQAVPLQGDMVGFVRTRLFLLLGAVGLVLCIACANVANLLLSRAATREREMAIRTALGAGRDRVVRQLLTESLLLASAGGLLGVVVAMLGLDMLKVVLPPETPRLMDVTLDWRVMAFAAALALVTGLFFGLAPALYASRLSLTDSLKSGGRGMATSGSQRMRSLLVIGEVALAAMLVMASGVLIRSFWTLSHVNPGFGAEHVVTARISPNTTFCVDAERCVNFYRTLLENVRVLPGLGEAAFVNTLPLSGRLDKRVVTPEGFQPAPGRGAPLFWMHVISSDYFRVMNIPLARGRAFTPAEVSSDLPVAIVTAATAKRYWPDDEPIGKRVRLLGQTQWRTVVGVTADVKAFDLQQNVPSFIDGSIYVPHGTTATVENGGVPAAMTFTFRTTLDEQQVGTMLRRIVAGLNAETSVSELKTMGDIVSESVSTPRSTTSLFVVFAGLALTLGMIGIYGVLAFFVSRRGREIGVRMALGAQRRDVLLMVMGLGAKYAACGLAIGFAGAFATTQLIAGELYGISPLDPIAIGAVTVVFVTVTLLACYVPARRAMRVDPLTALRAE
jgi:predicted permease